MSQFHAQILTIFPEMFPGPLGCSLAGKANKKSIWTYDIINIRDFGVTKHQNVDDCQIGGGNGLVMRPDVLSKAIDYAFEKKPDSILYYPSPRGKKLVQGDLRGILAQKNIIILCGRFEGIDERIIQEYNPCQINIGDFILSGGEIAAFVMLDSLIRLIPGVLANQETLKEESFEINCEEGSLLEYPLYTKPNIWRGNKVPEILLSGDHAKINKWKLEQSKLLTKKNRPDLLNN